MNTKIVRNFAMMALMLGAAFVLSGSKAQAQGSCSGTCSMWLDDCIGEACYPNGCGSGSPALQSCFNSYDQCLADCSGQ